MPRLSIYIPTWNRPELCHRLLTSIEPQLTDQVDVFVSINRGDTPYNLPDWVQHRVTEHNIGGDANICVGPTLTTGDYCWVVGDDEQLEPGAIPTLLEALQHNPGMVLHHPKRRNIKIQLGTTYPNYAAFCDALIGAGAGWVIAAQTCISATTFVRDKFDSITAFHKLDTHYAFHYGMLANLFQQPVHVLKQPTLIYGTELSVLLDSPDKIAEHTAMYPRVIHDIFRWIHENTGYPIPPDQFTHGFP